MKKLIFLLTSVLLLGCSAHKQALLPSTRQDDRSKDLYRLQAGDTIELIVTQRQDLSGEYKIGPDGTLALPLGGNIELKNLTREQAEREIETRLKKYYSPISLILKIKTFQSNAFYVIMGQVKEAGVYPIVNRISLLKALGTAKGFTQEADLNNIQLIRNAPEKQVIQIDLNEVMQNGDFSQDYILQKDDMIFVPRKPLANWMAPLKEILPIVQVGLLALITVNQL